MDKTTLFSELCLVHIFGGDYKTLLDVKPAEQGRPAYAVITLKASPDSREEIVIYEHRLWVVRAADKANDDQTVADFWKKFRTSAKVQVVRAGNREHINIFPIEEHRGVVEVRHELMIAKNLPRPEGTAEEIGVLVSHGKACVVRAAIWTLERPAVLRPNVPTTKPQTRGKEISPPALPKAKATAEAVLQA